MKCVKSAEEKDQRILEIRNYRYQHEAVNEVHINDAINAKTNFQIFKEDTGIHERLLTFKPQTTLTLFLFDTYNVIIMH